MKTLLVPLDFSDSSDAVLNHAETLAKELDARILLLHVIEPVATYIPVGASMDVLAAPATSESLPDEATILQRLQRLANRLTNKNVECRAIVGVAVAEILDQAEAESADYILLGSHGHGALYHLFSGSVVTGVLKKSKRPVIVIPNPSSH
jgi:nucleotide-binding universal stress UspA family protein